MNLGHLIDTLKAMPPRHSVTTEAGQIPCGFESYRGYYDQIALVPDGKEPVAAKDLLREAEAAVGKPFTGYKGGDYTMSRDTKVWVSSHGEASDISLAGAYISSDTVILTVTEGW